MSINERLKKTIENLKGKLEYYKNEYDKAVANYGEQCIQAIYSLAEYNTLEYVIKQLEEIVFDRKKWQQKYYQEHQEELREYNRKYKQDNKEKIKESRKEYNRKYREAHKEQLKEYREKRKAKDKSE